MTTRFDKRLEKIMAQLDIGETVGNPFRGYRVFTKSEHAAWLQSPEGQAHISEAGAWRNEPWRGNRPREFTGFYIIVCDLDDLRYQARRREGGNHAPARSDSRL